MADIYHEVTLHERISREFPNDYDWMAICSCNRYRSRWHHMSSKAESAALQHLRAMRINHDEDGRISTHRRYSTGG